ncbi:MAG: TonB-dependent receptor [Gemmatimonadales bacterium]|nr:MAG: TonB-dependent receptor [Gemmatimonadales bacterium]
MVPALTSSPPPSTMRLAAALILALALLVPDLSSAQAAPPSDTIRVEGVEVTVLRTPLRFLDAPLAVSIRGEEDLRRARSGAFLEEALQGLPGVQVQNRYNPAVGERVAIRGFGARSQFGVRGIRVIVDGIPATLPDGQSTLDHLDIGSLGRVEALRGPASALYGNASGGVLSFQTRRPPVNPVLLEAEVVGGSHGLQRGQATASGTAGETGYLVTLSSMTWDGYRSRPQDGAEGTYGQTDRLGLNARFLRPLAGGSLAFTLNLLELDAENPGSLPEAQRELDTRPAWGFNTVQRAGKEVSQQQAGLRWTGTTEGWDLDLSAFWIGRYVLNPIPSDIIDLDRDAFGLRTQIGRSVDTGWGALQWVAGVEADLQLDERLNFQNQMGERGNLTLDQKETVRSTGLFLQGTLPLPAARGEVMGGLRWDHHAFAAEDRFDRGPTEADATGDRTMTAISPSLGIHLPLAGETHLFASVGSFFETPSTTELANRPDGAGGFNPDLEPQRGYSGELGVRGAVDGRASWELTAYRTNLQNELVPFEVPQAPGRTFFRNAGSSYHQGLEATLSARPVPGVLRTEVAYTWTDARFRTFELDGEDLGGNRIPGVAPHRARLATIWTPAGARVELAGNYLHGVPVNDMNTATAPSHTLWDLRVAAPQWTLGTGTGSGLEPWFAVTNLLDEMHTASVAVNAFGGRFFEPGPGRSVQVGLRGTWGR